MTNESSSTPTDPAAPDPGKSNTQTDADRYADEEVEDLPSANNILGTLFEESTLWPLLIVLLGSGGAFGAAMLILSIKDRNLFAAAALFLVFGMTVDIGLRARHSDGPRNIAKLLGGLWVSSALLAGIATYAGII